MLILRICHSSNYNRRNILIFLLSDSSCLMLLTRLGTAAKAISGKYQIKLAKGKEKSFSIFRSLFIELGKAFFPGRRISLLGNIRKECRKSSKTINLPVRPLRRFLFAPASSIRFFPIKVLSGISTIPCIYGIFQPIWRKQSLELHSQELEMLQSPVRWDRKTEHLEIK